MLTEQAETRERLSKMGDAMIQVSRDISNQQAAMAAANASRNINCTSTRFGDQINTSCH